MMQHHDRHTMERMREHLVRADGELEAARHFLDPGSAEGATVRPEEEAKDTTGLRPGAPHYRAAGIDPNSIRYHDATEDLAYKDAIEWDESALRQRRRALPHYRGWPG